MPLFQFFPGEYFSGGELIGQGPLWFVEVLLIFSLIYVLWQLLVRSRTTNSGVEAKKDPFPRNGTIAFFSLLLGLAGFPVGLLFVMDVDRFVPLNLQLPFFVQYIALSIVGLVAYRRNWCQNLPDRTGRLWLVIACIMIILWVPMMFASGAANGSILFKGGWHWQSLLYALWESFLCISMCIGLI
ncbi:MAG: hypothetical protein OEU97_02510 [Dehalococcoidia bacterium]|nr:hypothetical protein [Dehalococcoidia bacterium]MDH4299280.1 hypothetical protein [Dehalococcoidia bacterium]MDH4366749.1 hypothetical protein [Dehalococcoidia bacterium]